MVLSYSFHLVEVGRSRLKLEAQTKEPELLWWCAKTTPTCASESSAGSTCDVASEAQGLGDDAWTCI